MLMGVALPVLALPRQPALWVVRGTMMPFGLWDVPITGFPPNLAMAPILYAASYASQDAGQHSGALRGGESGRQGAFWHLFCSMLHPVLPIHSHWCLGMAYGGVAFGVHREGTEGKSSWGDAIVQK